MPTVITFAAGTAQTVSTFSATGSAGNLVVIQSDSGYQRATISISLPNTTLNYCSVQNMIFTGASKTKAVNSYDLGGNLGVRFVEVTLTDILNDIDTRLPNKFTSTQKLGWLNDTQRKIWKYFNDDSLCDFDTIVDQASYPIPNDMKYENIRQVWVSSSTTAIGSTTLWNEYDYAGFEDSKPYNWFKDDGRLGIYPTPQQNGYHIRVLYEPRAIQLASTDVEIPYLNQDYLDALKYAVMTTIAKSGNYPDVELANNYQNELNEIVSMARFDKARRKAKTPKITISYKEGWD